MSSHAVTAGGEHRMSDARPTQGAVPLERWLQSVHEAVGPAAGAPLTTEERDVLLALARIAAHASERISAPLTTFLAGVAYGVLPEGERAEALRSLAATLEG
jgi:hypothetical protein